MANDWNHDSNLIGSSFKTSAVPFAEDDRVESAIGFSLSCLINNHTPANDLIQLTSEDEMPEELLNEVFDELVEHNSTCELLESRQCPRATIANCVLSKICFHFIKNYRFSVFADLMIDFDSKLRSEKPIEMNNQEELYVLVDGKVNCAITKIDPKTGNKIYFVIIEFIKDTEIRNGIKQTAICLKWLEENNADKSKVC